MSQDTGDRNWGKFIKKRWSHWQNKRLLKDYFRNYGQADSRVSRFLQDFFGFFILALMIIWYVPTVSIALYGVVILGIVLIWRRMRQRKKEDAELKKACYQKVAEKEFSKRLEKTAPETISKLLGAEIMRNFPVENLRFNNGLLEGRYQGERIVVVYLDVNGSEEVSTKELFMVIRKCLHEGITQLRFFTNGEYGVSATNLQQRYDLDLRLYNKEKLRYMLKCTALFPSLSEIKTIVDRDKVKKYKKLLIVKKGMFDKSKFSQYVIYSLLLLVMAWYRIGFVYLNLIAGLVLLGLAMALTIKRIIATFDERDNESSFPQKGF